MVPGLDDTICAIATPVGEGGIGIVRLSGAASISIADRLVRLRSGNPLARARPRYLHLADIRTTPVSETSPHPDIARPAHHSSLDEVLVVAMKAPRSYTGEDVVEIHCHGGPLILATLCRLCLASGARLAEPGEFTKRAFLNGRFDLSQAEAVLDTIRAKSTAGLTAAQRHLRGELAREVERLRTGLLTLLAHVEAAIDFAEEDVNFVGRDESLRQMEHWADAIAGFAATAKTGRVLREGASVVIVGRPNVGKSSLMNRLLRDERAIVTEVPGTTRDLIEESLTLDGVTLRLMDTAGLRSTADPVESEGIRRTRRARSEADLVLLVLDGSMPVTAEDEALLAEVSAVPSLIVINKADLPRRLDMAAIQAGVHLDRDLVVEVSAKVGAGLDTLRDRVRSRLMPGRLEPDDSLLVTNVRHQAALHRAHESLRQAMVSVREGRSGECVALDLRAAADALGEITGVITTDEILDRIFSDFCIGK